MLSDANCNKNTQFALFNNICIRKLERRLYHNAVTVIGFPLMFWLLNVVLLLLLLNVVVIAVDCFVVTICQMYWTELDKCHLWEKSWNIIKWCSANKYRVCKIVIWNDCTAVLLVENKRNIFYSKIKKKIFFFSY